MENIKWLHDVWTAERVQAFEPLALAPRCRDDIREVWKTIPDQHKSWLVDEIILPGTLPLKVTGAWIIPLLSSEACEHIILESELSPWEENDIEEVQYRIPEQVLKYTNPVLDQYVKKALFASLSSVLMTIFGRLPDAYNSVQLTKYNPTLRAEGNYHIDSTSDYTAVICLNQDFTGGGTTLCDGLLGEITLPPLPVGSALLFEGKKVLHKGNQVTEGERRLLTVWMNNEDPTW